MKRIKLLLLTLAFAMTFGGALAPVVVAGATPMAGPVFADFKDSACEGIGQIGGKCGGGGGTIEKAMKAAINIFSIVVGFAAVIVVIISGLRFITSGGDAANVAKARSGLIYAIVGLVLVVMAQTIVHFVLGKVK